MKVEGDEESGKTKHRVLSPFRQLNTQLRTNRLKKDRGNGSGPTLHQQNKVKDLSLIDMYTTLYIYSVCH